MFAVEYQYNPVPVLNIPLLVGLLSHSLAQISAPHILPVECKQAPRTQLVPHKIADCRHVQAYTHVPKILRAVLLPPEYVAILKS